MKQNKILILLSGLTLVTLALSSWGLTTGLPSAAQTALVAGKPETLARLSPTLKTLREEVYAYYSTLGGNDLRKYYAPSTDRVTIDKDGAPVSLEKRKLHAIRSGLMQTRYPDEPKVWAALARLNPAKGEFNTHLYQYGGLHLYSCAAAVKAASVFGVFRLTSQAEYYFTHPGDLRRMYLVPRLWGALVAALGVPLIFLCARRLYGLNAAVAAAVLYAVIPAVSIEAHSFKPYAFSLTIILATLLFTLRFLESERTADLALASLFSGLSAGALILNGVFILCPLAGLVISGKRRSPGLFVLVLAGFAVGLLATNPNWLLAPREVQSEMASQRSGWPFQYGIARLAHHFFLEFYKQFSLPLYVLVVAGFVSCLVRPDAPSIVMLAAFVPYYLFIANQFPESSHYAVPLVPFGVLMAARAAAFLSRRTMPRRAVPALLTAVAAVALANSVFYDLYIGASHRNLLAAGQWINENLPAGSSVGTSVYPSFGAGGYPPFRLLDYRVNETDAPEYYISMRKDDVPAPAYRPVKTFAADVPVLGRIFSNGIYSMWDVEVRIFERRKETA